jgi:ABC-2 type transport system permease protein
MMAVVRMEWIKLRSVRSTWWSLAIVAAGMIGLGMLILSQEHWATMAASDRASFDPTDDGFAGLAEAQLVTGVIGVLTITSEFSSGLIRATFGAVPRRPKVLAAKAAVLTAVTLVAGEILAFAAFFAAEAALAAPAPHASLGQPGVLRAVLLAGVYPALACLIGLGLGALLRHTAGAICALVGVIFLLPLLAQALPQQDRWRVMELLPEVIAQNSLTAVKPVAQSLNAWAGLAVLVGYVAVALVAGGWALTRRDA